jgi:lipocalin
MKFYLTGALALVLASAAVQSTQARKEDELITLTGCVQGFAQGGYFLSDSTDKNGKPKHYLLVNDNDEVQAFTGKWVEVSGRPSDFSWGVKITTADNRTLKTGSVFGVDTVKLVRDSCSNGAAATSATVASR